MSKVSQNNPFEQIFKALTAQILTAAKEMAIGTVSSVSASGIGITIDGDSSGVKKYTCNRAARFASGDRVLCARESGTWVVICKIGAPGGPSLKTSAMTQEVGTDADGKLWTTPPQATNIPTASTSAIGGVKTSAAWTSTGFSRKIAVNSSGEIFGEDIPTAGASTLGGVKPVAKTSAMTQDVGVDASGKLYTAPGAGAYTLPTASTTQKGGIQTSETYNGSKHTAKVAVNTSGVLYAEAYNLPTAGATTLGGVKPVTKTSAMTQDVGVDSSGKLYTAPGAGAYTLPTASTTTLGGVKTSATYSSTTHTLDVAIDSSGKLHAAAPPAASNVSRIYAGSSTSNYVELNSSKVFAPNGTGFDLGSSAYPWQTVYFGKNGSSSYYLKVENANILPVNTSSLTSYYNLGSSSYPFNALYVKKLYVNGKEVTP